MVQNLKSATLNLCSFADSLPPSHPTPPKFTHYSLQRIFPPYAPWRIIREIAAKRLPKLARLEIEQIARTPRQIGEALRRRRRGLGVSQTDLGLRTQLRQATVSSVEAGSPGVKLGTLCDLLAALDLELVVRPRSRGEAVDPGEIF